MYGPALACLFSDLNYLHVIMEELYVARLFYAPAAYRISTCFIVLVNYARITDFHHEKQLSSTGLDSSKITK